MYMNIAKVKCQPENMAVVAVTETEQRRNVPTRGRLRSSPNLECKFRWHVGTEYNTAIFSAMELAA
jgi:hypothetical protein